MTGIQRLYRKGLRGVGPYGDIASDWRWGVALSFIVYVIVLIFRCSFAGRWDIPELWVEGERILATHDAYFWLAKARGVGPLEGYPIAIATKWIHDLTGIGLGSIGFWGPAVVAPLSGVVCYLWGHFLGGRGAGLIAGILGSLTPGFFYRSRLGYFDTDLFTLLVPMLVAYLLARWASKHMRLGWLCQPEDEEAARLSPLASLGMIFAYGLITRFAIIWHTDIGNICFMLSLLTAGLLVVLCAPGKRGLSLFGISVFILIALPGNFYGQIIIWPFAHIGGIIRETSPYYVSAGLAALYVILDRRGAKVITSVWIGLATLLAVLLITGLVQVSIFGVVEKMLGYSYQFGGMTSEGGLREVLGPIYPSILQSIIEAKQVPFGEILSRGAYAAWIGSISLICVAIVLVFRPTAALLLPLIALQLLSVKLGVRFSMFGGAALIVCLGVCFNWMLRFALDRWGRGEVTGLVGISLLSICCLGFMHTTYSQLPLTPVVAKEHAEALVRLGETAESDDRVWTWWDWGYATQYYSGLQTVVDGGRHAGRDVYPVAYSFSVASPRKANRMIVYSARYPASNRLAIGLEPAKEWDKLPRTTVNEAIDTELSAETYPSVVPQYLVVTWKDLTIAKWISYYGNWDLETGKTSKFVMVNYDPGELGFNLQRGAIMDRRGGGGLMGEIAVLDEGKSDIKEYFMNKLSSKLVPKTPYLAINKVSRQSVLMDRSARESMMTRLLIGDPNDPEISKYFKLVVDKLPFARIYEVVQ